MSGWTSTAELFRDAERGEANKKIIAVFLLGRGGAVHILVFPQNEVEEDE